MKFNSSLLLFLIVHQIMIMITIMMLQLRYAQPCMKYLIKLGEIVTTVIGNWKTEPLSLLKFQEIQMQLVIILY